MWSPSPRNWVTMQEYLYCSNSKLSWFRAILWSIRRRTITTVALYIFAVNKFRALCHVVLVSLSPETSKRPSRMQCQVKVRTKQCSPIPSKGLLPVLNEYATSFMSTSFIYCRFYAHAEVNVMWRWHLVSVPRSTSVHKGLTAEPPCSGPRCKQAASSGLHSGVATPTCSVPGRRYCALRPTINAANKF
jgi:hypothetical protein